MKKLTKTTPLIWFQVGAHNTIVTKQGKFTLQDICEEMLSVCTEDITLEYIRPIVLGELNKILKSGAISLIEDGVYQNNIFKKEETQESTL